MSRTKIKTKLFAGVAGSFGLKKALIVLNDSNNNVELSARNLPGIKVVRQDMLNVYDLLKHPQLVMVQGAAQAVQDGGEARRRMVAAAKIHVGRAGRLVADECIQMHGAIGMTDEYAIGHYAKRMLAIDTLFGDADHHLGRFPLDLKDTQLILEETNA